MSVEAISTIQTSSLFVEQAKPVQSDFVSFLKSEAAATDIKIQAAESNLKALALGETENLHQVMLSISKAKTSFEMIVEVRNKLLESYQEIMRTQI